MAFERSLEIARRLDDVLHLIRTGHYSTPKLAEEVGVSIPTISRIVAALRERGHEIEAKRYDGSWRYVIVCTDSSNNPKRRIAARGKLHSETTPVNH